MSVRCTRWAISKTEDRKPENLITIWRRVDHASPIHRVAFHAGGVPPCGTPPSGVMVDVRSDIHPTTSLQLPRPMDSIPAQSAFVLHSRPYRESSALVDFLTPQGRFRAVLRGARGKAGTLARPFVPLEVEFRGRGDL